MIDVYDLWLDFCAEYNTHQRGHVRPESTFLRWVNNISKDLFEEKFANWPKSQGLSDDLSRPFLRSRIIRVEKGNVLGDLMPYPGDYAHFSSARFYVSENKVIEPSDLCDTREGFYKCNEETIYTEKIIKLIDNNRWSKLLEHKMKRPSIVNPAMTQYDSGFKVSPKNIPYIIFDYLKKPVDATFVYTTASPGDFVVYDRAASKKLEWSPLLKGEFLARLGLKYGKFTGSQMVYEMSNAEKKSV